PAPPTSPPDWRWEEEVACIWLWLIGGPTSDPPHSSERSSVAFAGRRSALAPEGRDASAPIERSTCRRPVGPPAKASVPAKATLEPPRSFGGPYQGPPP